MIEIVNWRYKIVSKLIKKKKYENCDLDSSSDRQFTQFLFQLLEYYSKCSNDNWHNCHLHVQQFFQLSGKVVIFVLFFAFFYF